MKPSKQVVLLAEFIWEGHHREWYAHFYKCLVDEYEVICIVPNPDDWAATVESQNLVKPLKVFEFKDPRDDADFRTALKRKVPGMYQSMRFNRLEEIIKTCEKEGLELAKAALFCAHLPHGAYWGDIPQYFNKLAKVSGLLLDLTTLRVNPLKSLFKHRILQPLALYQRLEAQKLCLLEEDCMSLISAKVPSVDFLLLPEPVVEVERKAGWESGLVADDRSLLSQLNELKESDSKCCLVIGRLSKSKGLHDLMKLWRETPHKERWVICLVGQIDWNSFNQAERAYVEEFIRAETTHIYHFHRVESEVLYQYCFEAADLLYAVYKDFLRSSSTLSYAAFSRTPSLVSDQGVMAERVLKYSIGCVVSKESPRDLDLLSQCANKNEPKWAEYCRINSMAQFDEIVRTALA